MGLAVADLSLVCDGDEELHCDLNEHSILHCDVCFGRQHNRNHQDNADTHQQSQTIFDFRGEYDQFVDSHGTRHIQEQKHMKLLLWPCGIDVNPNLNCE